MVQLAKETGLTREGLYKALSKDGNPSLGTVLKVLKATWSEIHAAGRLRETQDLRSIIS
jgi:probable addiction module antidote protein